MITIILGILLLLIIYGFSRSFGRKDPVEYILYEQGMVIKDGKKIEAFHMDKLEGFYHY